MNWYNDISKLFMSRGYLRQGQTIEEKIEEIAEHSKNILGKNGKYKDRLIYHLKKGNYIVPTPVWKNFHPSTNETPISCFGVFVEDTVESIVLKASEVALQNKIGGGSSGTFEEVRGRGKKISTEGFSNGSVSMMEIFQTISSTISQPNRRGHFSATQDIDHSDSSEFMGARTEGHAIQDLSTGLKISDAFMQRALDGDEDSIEKLRRLVKARYETGFHYVFFSDTVNKNTVDVYKDKNYRINHSNMCQEIALPNSKDETFVCNLLGMNIVNFDEWKDTDAIEIGIYFMDSMLQDFIRKMKLKKEENEDYYNVLYRPAVTFAERHMSMGMGASGLHSYFQSKGIVFDSIMARALNKKIFKTIKDGAYKASEKMAIEYGKPDMLKDKKYKRRHCTLTAVAPNTSSSFIMGQQSQSIEPMVSNYYVRDVAKTRISFRNPHLEKLLEKKNKNTEEVWLSILKNGGSVRDLDFLSEEEKAVFRTFIETSQLSIIEMASDRQKYICQSQSLNIMVGKDTEPDEVMYWILKAWKLGVKTLYYQLNVNSAQDFTNKRAKECESCSG